MYNSGRSGSETVLFKSVFVLGGGGKFPAVLARNNEQKQLALSSFQFHRRCNI